MKLKIPMFRVQGDHRWHQFIDARHEQNTREEGTAEIETFIPISAVLSDEAVEVGAEELCRRESSQGGRAEWGDLTEDGRDSYRDAVRALLGAVTSRDAPKSMSRLVFVCPGNCDFIAMQPGHCRSHPYPCRAMGPELVPVLVSPIGGWPSG
jgi:hypothetical protein